MNRAPDWLLQAEKDLSMARIALEAGRHEWACFAAHQSAEKALKALHLFLGQEVWGHLVARLLRELPFSAPTELVDMARALDALYIPTRYPDAFPAGAPAEHYGLKQSQEALNHAQAILEFVRAQMAQSDRG
ncbi:HEPN domain-containing protein [Meiothermus sp. CFH 77666]|uniref:HEPN domain-containing protein n=1 Tax=Meiothermus sp. CFH 77666 TaxID=2817942 RepID=UPI001AA0AFF9|nr:HEPN domain-containing protein [Meiothermus sp. CFH 77666]